MIVIQTKEKKVTIMSAKPSSIPPSLELPKAETPKVTKTSGYNDAFAQFLAGNTKPVVDPETPSPLKPVSDKHEARIPPKISIEPGYHSPSPLLGQESITQQTKKSSPAIVTTVQKKQEAWTSKILEQTQSQQQKVKTERIQPYVSGQNSIYANQVKSENDQQVFCTIASAPAASQQQILAKAIGKSLKQKQQS